MMFGAMKAMDEAGITYGTDGDVITISFDALGEAFDRLQKKELMVTVECNPLLAGLCEKTIRYLHEGKEVDPIQYIEESVFTYENYARYIDTRMY
jgi:simple sugar transport system substrate-binding protein